MSAERSSAPRRAVLVDFGGVLTTSVFDAFAGFGATHCDDPDLPLRLLGSDPEAKQALVDHEEGRLDHDGFEQIFARRLGAHGVEIEAEGLIAKLQQGLLPDEAMIAVVADLRAAGVPVGLVSNSLGRDCYAGFDLASMFDALTISGAEGVRKPSRRLYEIGCERLGVAPHEAVMVDDLAQNIVAAERLGMAGVVHRSAQRTAEELAGLLGGALVVPTGAPLSTTGGRPPRP